MSREVTLLLGELAEGRRQAAAELLPAVYAELRRLAASQVARLKPGDTLQATALVHEAYLKLVRRSDPGWNSRGHFFAAAAQAMRELVVDHVRRKASAKRGGGRAKEPLEAAIAVADAGLGTDDVLAVDAAIARLADQHPRKAQLVVMRYFGGLSEDEIAEALGVTARTVQREWRFARAWLHADLSAGAA